MPAGQQEYFVDLTARPVGGRNQKIDCYLQMQGPPRRTVIGLALCAVRLKESLDHGGQHPYQKELDVGVRHVVAEELSQAIFTCN